MDITVNSKWTRDCCGKQDLDFPIIDANTRYWPDFSAECEIEFLSNFCASAPRGEKYVESNFKPIVLEKSEIFFGESEEDVKQKVKEWYNAHIVSAMEKALKLIQERP